MSHETENIAVTWVKNPLDPENSAQHLPMVYIGGTVEEYVRKLCPGNDDIYCTINGTPCESDKIVSPGDHICFAVVPHDDDVWRFVGMLAVTIAAAWTQQWWATKGLWGGLVGSFAASAVVTVAGSMAVNAAFPPIPKNVKPLKEIERSPNYGWGMPSNNWQEGAALPSLIGERRFAPPRIGGYRHLPADDPERQRLRMQFALCDDQIEPITDDDIFINGTKIIGYPGAEWEHTQGRDDEDYSSKFFQDTFTEKTVNTQLDDAAENFTQALNYTDFVEGTYQPAGSYITIDQNVTAIVVNAGMRDKRKVINAFGPIYGEDTDFRLIIEYRVVGQTTWQVWEDTCDIRWPLRRVGTNNTHKFSAEIYGLTENQYEVRFTISDPAGTGNHGLILYDIVGYTTLATAATVTTTGTDVEKVGFGLYFPAGLYYLNDDGSFGNHTIRITYAVRPYGQTDWTRAGMLEITEATGDAFRRFVSFDGLTPDQWECQCFVSGTMPSSNRYQHTVYWEYLQEGVDQGFTYPGTAVLSVEIPATASTNGSWPSVEVKAKKIDYGATHSSKNPAWAAYYRMRDKYGYDENSLILSEFSNWATFCDNNNLTVAGYIDTQLLRKAVIDNIGIAGMAAVIPKGSKWGVIIDTERDPEQTFGSDNIIDGTFEEIFTFTNRANTALVWFYDADNANRKTPLEVRVSGTEDEPTRKIERTLFFVDNQAQAIKHANQLLNKSQLVKRMMNWESFADAINCQVGDVVYLQNNLPVWGVAPGRVVSATSTSVTCDIPLDFDDSDWNGRSLRIIVRHQSPDTGEYVDYIERHPITNPYPNTGVVTYNLDSAAFARTPVADSLVMIGWVTGSEQSTSDELLSVKQVEILSIDHQEKNRYKITAAEYYDDAYAENYVISTLPANESGLSVDNLIGDTGFFMNGRTQLDKIVLNWTGAAERFFIYYKTYDTTNSTWGSWKFYSVSYSTSISISNLPTGLTYRFSVSVINAPDDNQTVDVVFNTTDFVDVIESGTNLRCADTGDTTWDAIDLDIVWDVPSLFTVKYYKVEIYNAAEDTVLRTHEAHKDNSRFVYTLEMNAQDHGGTPSASVKVKVSVVDVNGNESATAITEFTNGAPAAVTNLQTTAGSGTAFEGPALDIVWTAPADNDILHYQVTINHGGADLRTEYVTDTRYVYTKDMNVEDGGGTASNVVIVKVYAIDYYGNTSTVTSATFTNPAPAIPGSLGSSPWMNGIQFTWAVATDRDWLKWQYRVQVESEGWTSWFDTTSNEINVFLNDTQADTYNNGATIYFEVRAVDTFGTASTAASTSGTTGSLWIPPTAMDDFTQISAAFYEVPVLRNFTWTNNSPSAGNVSWSAGDLYYNGTKYSITSGNTSDHYIYWDPNGTTTVFGTTDLDTSLPEGAFIIAANNDGTYSLAWNNAIANQVIGSSWIRDAAIVTAKINDLAVTNAKINDLDASKITTGYLSADRIDTATITISKLHSSATNLMFTSSSKNSSELNDNANLGGTADWSGLSDVPPFGNASYATDPSNMVSDYDFSRTTGMSDQTFWSISGGGYPIEWLSNNGYNQTPGINIYVTGSYNYLYENLNGSQKYIRVKRYDEFWFQIRAFKTSNADADLKIGFTEYNKSYYYARRTVVTPTLIDDEWSIDTVKLTVGGSTTEYITVTIYTENGTGGNYYIDDVYFGRHEPAATVGATLGVDIGGSNLPADNATVGADWSSNLSNIPSHLADTAPDNSIAIDGTFIGFHATGVNWPIRIQNDGGVGKFYCGDGSNTFIEFDGTNFNLQPSAVNILAGADINLTGSDTDPGKINFEGTSYTVEIGGDADGNRFYISPNTTGVISCYIGNNEYSLLNRFYKIDLDAIWSIDAHCYRDSTHEAYMNLTSLTDQAYWTLRLESGTIDTGMRFYASSYAIFYPYLDHKVVDLGQSSNAFDDAYADDWNNVADIPILDEIKIGNEVLLIDDLSVLANIKPSQKRDGRTGMLITNDSTLPTWFASKYKADGEEKVPDLKENEDPDEWKPSGHWHWVQPGDRIRFWKRGSTQVDTDGKPYISTKTHLGLHDGAFRALIDEQAQIHSMIEYLQTQINEMKGK